MLQDMSTLEALEDLATLLRAEVKANAAAAAAATGSPTTAEKAAESRDLLEYIETQRRRVYEGIVTFKDFHSVDALCGDKNKNGGGSELRLRAGLRV